jgi:hypothetical protein
MTHQLAGAHLLGLDAENETMLRSYAASATAEHKYFPVWALNFDAKTYLSIDYKSPDNFVREVPADLRTRGEGGPGLPLDRRPEIRGRPGAVGLLPARHRGVHRPAQLRQAQR